jgi:hypothetical protein
MLLTLSLLIEQYARCAIGLKRHFHRCSAAHAKHLLEGDCRMKIKFLAFIIAGFLFVVTSNISYADDSKLTIEQLIENRTMRADVEHWCRQQVINRPELRDVFRQIEVCKNFMVANYVADSPDLVKLIKAPERWPGESTNFFAKAALMGGSNDPYHYQNRWCSIQYMMRTKDILWGVTGSKPDYRSISKGCAAAYPVTVMYVSGRGIVKVNGERFLDAEVSRAVAAKEQAEKAKEQAEKAKEQAEWERKSYIFQGGLTWMAITFYKRWAEANSYCTNTTIRGQSGWRLPTKDELGALYAGTMKNKMEDKGWLLRQTWSSTPGSSGAHYNFDLDDGRSFSSDDRYTAYVTCVR